jgi:hypothetical protein
MPPIANETRRTNDARVITAIYGGGAELDVGYPVAEA